MGNNLRPNRFEIFALIAVIATTALAFREAMDAADLYTSMRVMSGWEQFAGCFGWLLATFGPIVVATIFWRISKRLRKAWILHALMLPIAYGLVQLGASIMLTVIGHPDFDATIGGPIVQALLLSGLAVVGYYAAVIYGAFVNWRKQVNSG